MTRITSRHHPVVATFRETARGIGADALLDGWHLLHDALEAGLAIKIVAIAGEPRDPMADRILARLDPRTEVLSVSTSTMKALSPVQTPSGVAALVRRTDVDFPALLRPAPALVVAAIEMQDPGNVGAMIRAAEAGGATGVVCGEGSADPWGWKALRGAMGSTFRLPVMKAPDSAAVFDALQEAGVRLVATEPRGGTPMVDVDLRPPTAVIFGGEGAGLPVSVLDRVAQRISIPMQAPVESLNVAVAAALIVYEARRQRMSEAPRRSRS